jgi:hypothetical protein
MAEGRDLPPAGDVVELDGSACPEDSPIEVFAPTVEPQSGATEAANKARGRNLIARMRDWLRRVA